MAWIAKYMTKEPIPTKGYVNDLVENAYDKPHLLSCREHLQEILNKENLITDSDPQFLLALFWASEHDCMVDVLGYSQLDEGAQWPGNLEVSKWIFKNGFYRPKDVGVTCTDGIIIAGQEELFRRRCANLEEYLGKFPSALPVEFSE
ncbi:hypothetical protein KY329_05505 [Candidatus Woesearchaeota archaeon]|nr:hypothetical protein [Candidatus Woesearchaeota archaeon]